MRQRPGWFIWFAATVVKMKVVAFDCFGTVFDLSGVSRQEIADYAAHIRKAEWSPLVLPESWLTLTSHSDSRDGIEEIRKTHFVVALSNAPMGMIAKLSKLNGIRWDAIIPLEMFRVFKPNPRAYLAICDVLGCNPDDVTMVTANKTFGDLEGARSVGMNSVLIRGESDMPDIIAFSAKF